MKDSPDPVNLGVLFQLTGDATYAEQAQRTLREKHEKEIPVFGFGSGGFGHEIFRAALAYDLCADAWPPSFRAWVRDQLVEFTRRHQFVLMTSHANFHPCSNYYGPGRGVPGVASMVLWGDGAKKPAHSPAFSLHLRRASQMAMNPSTPKMLRTRRRL